ncbi:trypsin-like serine peptidase [Actinomadura kijaniata]|uniref:trypsin-like serine peptidase n=1 Tax=Actinomadura kijaniata TaxID=46161 RepID=UPI003F1DFEAA
MRLAHQNPLRGAVSLLTALFVTLSTLSVITLSAPAQAQADTAADDQFVPLTPTPLLDTRNGTGTTTGKVPAQGSVTFQVAGRGGVPTSGASAAVLNISAFDPTAFGWFYVHPSDKPSTISTLTYHASENTTGEDFTQLTATGKVTVVNKGNSPVHITVAVRGYFQNGAEVQAGNEYYPVDSDYLYDTRPSLATGSPLKNIPIAANSSVTFEVAGQKTIPLTGVTAVALNVVATGQTAEGSLSLYQSDQVDPKVPTVSYESGESNTSFTVARLSGTGKLTLTNHGNTSIDVSVTLRGYFKNATAEGGTGYQPTDTVLLVETLRGVGVTSGSTEPLAPGESMTFDATTATGLEPEKVAAVALNINARQPTHQGWLSVYPYLSEDPRISSVNFDEGGETTNGFDVLIPGVGGRMTITNHSGGTVHIQASMRGYYLDSNPEDLATPVDITAESDGSRPSDSVVAKEIDTEGGLPDVYVDESLSVTSQSPDEPEVPADTPGATADSVPPMDPPAPEPDDPEVEALGHPGATSRFYGKPGSWPAIAIGKLFYQRKNGGDWYGCSATVINTRSKSVVWTAAHCLWDKKAKRQMKNIWFAPNLKSGNVAPYGLWAARQISFPRGYSNKGTNNYDHGAVLLNRTGNYRSTPVQDQVGAFGWNFTDTFSHSFVYNLGYPGELNNGTLIDDTRLRYCTGSVRRRQQAGPDFKEMNCNMGRGSSGGPWTASMGSNPQIVGHNSFMWAGKNKIYSPQMDRSARLLVQWATRQ